MGSAAVAAATSRLDGLGVVVDPLGVLVGGGLVVAAHDIQSREWRSVGSLGTLADGLGVGRGRDGEAKTRGPGTTGAAAGDGWSEERRGRVHDGNLAGGGGRGDLGGGGRRGRLFAVSRGTGSDGEFWGGDGTC